MTDAQRRSAIIGLIERYTAANNVTRNSARTSLINEGIYTKKGKLRVEFGGDSKKEKASA